MHGERLGYALLLSVPVGVGVSIGAWKVRGRLDPLVVGAGLVTTLAILLVLAASFLTDDNG